MERNLLIFNVIFSAHAEFSTDNLGEKANPRVPVNQVVLLSDRMGSIV